MKIYWKLTPAPCFIRLMHPLVQQKKGKNVNAEDTNRVLPPCNASQNIAMETLPDSLWEHNDDVILHWSHWGNFPLACSLSRRSSVANNPLAPSKKRIRGYCWDGIVNTCKRENWGGLHLMLIIFGSLVHSCAYFAVCLFDPFLGVQNRFCVLLRRL